MASPTFNHAVLGETFLPGQIFVFGGFALRANSLGQLEQIDSFAPGHQIRFKNLNYTVVIRRDLIFDGFEPVPGAPDNHDEHGSCPDGTLLCVEDKLGDPGIIFPSL